MVIGLPGLGCARGGGAEPTEGVTLSEEIINLPPEVVLGNLFSIEFWDRQEQYWEEYKGKRVEWTGKVYNKERVNNKVAVSMEYVCQTSPLAHRNLYAAVIVYLDKTEATDLTKRQEITYTGHLYRRLYWDRREDAQELQLKLGYTGASAVTVEDGRLIK